MSTHKCTQTINKSEKQVFKQLIKSISHPIRVKILCLLCRNKLMYVNQIADTMQKSQNLISFHLSKLENVGLIKHKRIENQNFYFIDQELKPYIQYFFKFLLLINETYIQNELSNINK